ncbi:MAG: hypothetical protein DI628_05920 [Blastochloris viridis]|uniref:Uncharacterized protein n=1 Tax=Blastochloris viridis TaxID=1079 RepID=A0A6N4R7X6_BLAVI|nr:MAG: hypothetical protein DI628_05920 [Blastochloris viridis]
MPAPTFTPLPVPVVTPTPVPVVTPPPAPIVPPTCAIAAGAISAVAKAKAIIVLVVFIVPFSSCFVSGTVVTAWSKPRRNPYKL